MSLLGAAGQLGFAANIGLSAALSLESVLLRPYRAIIPTPDKPSQFPDDPIQADAVLEEFESSRLTITEHPVEQGAAIADHAYMEPKVVRLTYGWVPASLSRLPDPTFIRKLYDKLRSLQLTRTPFTIYTGKAVYVNMVLHDLSQRTNKETENALIVQAICREIIRVYTSVSRIDLSAVADPSANGASVSQGAQQLGPLVTNGLLGLF